MHVVVHVLLEQKAARTGVSTEGGETTAASWKWFDAMDEVMRQRPTITPPVLITSWVEQSKQGHQLDQLGAQVSPVSVNQLVLLVPRG